MGDVFDDLGVAGRGLGVVGARCQRARRREARPLLPHPLHFTLFRFTELRGDDDEA